MYSYNNYHYNFTKYLSTAPVIGTIWLVFTAGLIIEVNRFFPDLLFFPF
nr:photosystem I subunit IX [Rhodella violacea]UNJ18153.1 photosystem I subunit IX [Rhodella violacea]